MSHVRLDAPPENGSFVHSPSALCALTSENVTSSDLASVNGLSFKSTVNDPGAPLGPVAEPPHAAAYPASATAIANADIERIVPPDGTPGNGHTTASGLEELLSHEALSLKRDS